MFPRLVSLHDDALNGVELGVLVVVVDLLEFALDRPPKLLW